MICKRCGNSDPAYFYRGHKGYYCRKCVSFSRILLEEEPETFDYEIATGADEYRFAYELTDEQKRVSQICAETCEDNDVLLHCVCGAGKTEIAVEAISRHLAQGKKVAYAIPRREVVIELEKRFSAIFSEARVTAVYGGHHDVLDGDLIICTCHQLFRYYRTFDLLILDEVDAFPLKGNVTLMNIALNSCRGHIIFSTATVDEEFEKILKKRVYKLIELNSRPSGRKLPVPETVCLNRYLSLLYLFFLLRKLKPPCIVFVSSRKQCRDLYHLYRPFFSCTYVYSDLEERDQNIRAFREGKYPLIFSTTVLERGVTIRDVSVIIMNSGNIFDVSSLVQMLGRVDRGLEPSHGRCCIISDRHDKTVRSTLEYFREVNGG